MSRRIVYPVYSGGGLQGGHKMAFRHVETLRALGFNAVVYTGAKNVIPSWFEHQVPIVVDEILDQDRDVLVPADDSYGVLAQLAPKNYRVVVLVQGVFHVANRGLEVLDRFPAERFPVLLTVSHTAAEILRRAYPQARVSMVRAFADERRFRPGAARQDAVALALRKRPREAKIIEHLFRRLHPRHAGFAWRAMDGVMESELAATFASSTVSLTLSRMESLGMTPLEAMACGCVCAGFLGVGGRDFATPENGFWVPEDDCLAAADALAEAADLVASGGPALAHRLEAGFETARQWSYARFREELEAFWMEVAPDARRKDGPLDG